MFVNLLNGIVKGGKTLEMECYSIRCSMKCKLLVLKNFSLAMFTVELVFRVSNLLYFGKRFRSIYQVISLIDLELRSRKGSNVSEL